MESTPRPESAPIVLERTGPEGPLTIIKEVWWFVRTTGKWWLVPVLVALLLLGLVALLSGTGCGPFLYTLF